MLSSANAAITGWGFSLGSGRFPAGDVDRQFGLEQGTVEGRMGIRSVTRASTGESEVTLARDACAKAAGKELADVDLLLATSETQVGHPALAAALHAELKLPPGCVPMDIGGGCAGLVNALAVAQSMLASRARRVALVAASEVHSRWLTPENVNWKFGALFGDGACAFLLRPVEDGASSAARGFRLSDFVFGCETALAGTIRVGLAAADSGETLDVNFRGPRLADAALTRLAAILRDFAARLRPIADFAGYAIHQPNPRLVEMLARQLGVPLSKFPEVARTAGNLGSATCGVSLCHLLSGQRELDDPAPVLLAALGPGLLWGGACLHPTW